MSSRMSVRPGARPGITPSQIGSSMELRTTSTMTLLLAACCNGPAGCWLLADFARLCEQRAREKPPNSPGNGGRHGTRLKLARAAVARARPPFRRFILANRDC